MLKPNINIYKYFVTYMASSVSGEMNKILRCDWLPKRTFFCFVFITAIFKNNIINVFYFHFYKYFLSAVVFERKKLDRKSNFLYSGAFYHLFVTKIRL